MEGKKVTILDKLKSIEFDRNRTHVFGIKSGILWGHSSEKNCSFPLLYISKPKSVSQEDFELLLNNLQIILKK